MASHNGSQPITHEPCVPAPWRRPTTWRRRRAGGRLRGRGWANSGAPTPSGWVGLSWGIRLARCASQRVTAQSRYCRRGHQLPSRCRAAGAPSASGFLARNVPYPDRGTGSRCRSKARPWAGGNRKHCRSSARSRSGRRPRPAWTGLMRRRCSPNLWPAAAPPQRPSRTATERHG
jgi:hypothetical protein